MKNAIVRLGTVALAPRFIHRLWLVLLLLPLIAAQPDPARADDNADAANTAVQLFVTAGQAAGLPITQQEAAIVTQIVACGVSDPNVGTCVKNAAVATVLQQAGITDPTITDAVNCLTDGTKAETCATKAVLAVAKLPPDVQPAATCMLGGGNVVDCGKKLAEGVVLDKVPAEIQPVAKCIIEGGKAQSCATDFVTQQVISHLPTSPVNLQTAGTQVVNCLGASDVGACLTKAVGNVASQQVQQQLGPLAPLATCATQPGANLGQCAATFASNNMPPLPGGTDAVAKAVVACVGNTDFDSCVTQAGVKQAKDLTTSVVNQAGQQAIQAALDTINKLKPDAPMTVDAGVNSANIATLQNILKVADGIKNKDWGEVVMAAGPELAIVAGNILLSVFLTPAVADALGPAVAAMIHNDAAAAQLALQAIGDGNPVALAQVLFTWYETSLIDEPCALMGKDVQDTVCGDLSKGIKFISDAGGDLAKALLHAGQQVLEWLGVWGTVDDVATAIWNTVKGAVEDIGHFFGIGGGSKDDWKPAADCANFSPKDYFANNYLACIPAASQRPGTPGGLAGLASNIGAMNSACVAAFDRCIAPENRGKVASTCGAMGNALGDVANQVSAAMGTAADVYTNTLGLASYVSDQFKDAQKSGFGFGTPDFCDPDFWNADMQSGYAWTCSAFVNKQFPNPTPAPAACSPVLKYQGARTACSNSVAATVGTPLAKNLAGPNSAYCKAQQQWADDHHCTITYGKPMVVIGSGKDIELPRFTISCDGSLKKPPFGGLGDPVSFPLKPPGGQLLPPPGGFGGGPKPGDFIPVPPGGFGSTDTRIRPPFSAGLPKGGVGSSGINMINGDTNEGILKRPPFSAGLPKGGVGSSGINMINGNTNEGTLKKMPGGRLTPKKEQEILQRGANRAPAVPSRPVSSSGSNTSRSPSMGSSGNNAAMDRLGGMMSNSSINSVSGNQASSGQQGNGQRRTPGGGGASSSGYNTSKPIPAGGGGGVGSSGISTSRPIPSAPKTPAPRNDPIDYGGCAGCGRQQDDLHVR